MGEVVVDRLDRFPVSVVPGRELCVLLPKVGLQQFRGREETQDGDVAAIERVPRAEIGRAGDPGESTGHRGEEGGAHSQAAEKRPPSHATRTRQKAGEVLQIQRLLTN